MQSLAWEGNRRYTTGQMVVTGLRMEAGAAPVDGSMVGVRQVSFVSPQGGASVVEACELRAPNYEVVAVVGSSA